MPSTCKQMEIHRLPSQSDGNADAEQHYYRWDDAQKEGEATYADGGM